MADAYIEMEVRHLTRCERPYMAQSDDTLEAARNVSGNRPRTILAATIFD